MDSLPNETTVKFISEVSSKVCVFFFMVGCLKNLVTSPSVVENVCKSCARQFQPIRPHKVYRQSNEPIKTHNAYE